jgi:hypothetical protein
MFIMFVIDDFSSLMNPEIGETLQYASTWEYYNTGEVFGLGNFSSFQQNFLVLSAINLVLEIASVIVLEKKDIPI